MAYALFAHCFTCSKDSRAAKRMAEALAMRGIALLRFDFTGLGSSEGDFANTDFSSNVDDRRRGRPSAAYPPGAGAAHRPQPRRCCGARGGRPGSRGQGRRHHRRPVRPGHIADLLGDRIDGIRENGEGEVVLGGRAFRIRREFLDDIAEQNLLAQVGRLRKPLLVMHAPTDRVVPIDSATRIFPPRGIPRVSSLDDADHMLARRRDAEYAADVIAAWASRYLAPADPPPQPVDAEEPRAVEVVETGVGVFQQSVTAGPHRLVADEPTEAGGLDTGPAPYDLLLASWGRAPR